MNIVDKIWDFFFRSKTMKKVAVCVGINKYPDPQNNLQGCVNDANDWATLLSSKFGFDEVTTILNRNANIRNVVKTIQKKLDLVEENGVFVFTDSSHGSSVPDKNKDESDGRDECICLYDAWLIDDDIRKILSSVKKKITIVIISDSCHSGTVTRATNDVSGTIPPVQEYKKIRYIPPKDEAFAKNVINLPVVKSVLKDAFLEADMNHILLSGCKATEYSYDAQINGRYNGAMSYYATKVLRENQNLTYSQFYKELMKYLPNSQYPQTPQLEGSKENKNKLIFT